MDGAWFILMDVSNLHMIKTINKIYITVIFTTYGEFFSTRDKRQSKNRGCNGNANFGGQVLEKSSSQIWTYICIYSYAKRYFPKHNLWTCDWYCKAFFLNGAYCVLEKSSSNVHTTMDSSIIWSIFSLFFSWMRSLLIYMLQKWRTHFLREWPV